MDAMSSSGMVSNQLDTEASGAASGSIHRRRSGLTEHVYAYVKEQILAGRFQQDTWIPVEQVAADLAVSRQPVMDALKRLAMEGFTTIIPQVGCRIRAYSPGEIADFYRLFAEGEALVAELAARRATAADIIGLKAISAHIGELASHELDRLELARLYRGLNRRLHLEIRRIARSFAVTEVVETLGDRSDFFVATAHAPIFADRLRSAHQEHEEVLSAIIRRDAAMAGRVMHAHILAIGARLDTALRG